MRLGCFGSAREVSREISGVKCSVKKMKWNVALTVIQRLVADVGEFAAKVIASPDDELDPQVELMLRAIAVQTLQVKTESAASMTVRALRAMCSVQFLAAVKTIDLHWYVENCIVGHATIDGTPITNAMMLDDAGCTASDVFALLSLALEANVNPTSAGANTSDGNDASAVREPKIRGKSSVKGESVKAGR